MANARPTSPVSEGDNLKRLKQQCLALLKKNQKSWCKIHQSIRTALGTPNFYEGNAMYKALASHINTITPATTSLEKGVKLLVRCLNQKNNECIYRDVWGMGDISGCQNRLLKDLYWAEWDRRKLDTPESKSSSSSAPQAQPAAAQSWIARAFEWLFPASSTASASVVVDENQQLIEKQRSLMQRINDLSSLIETMIQDNIDAIEKLEIEPSFSARDAEYKSEPKRESKREAVVMPVSSSRLMLPNRQRAATGPCFLSPGSQLCSVGSPIISCR